MSRTESDSPILEWFDEHASLSDAIKEFSDTIPNIIKAYGTTSIEDPILLTERELNRPAWVGASTEPLGGAWLRLWTALYLIQDSGSADPALFTPEWEWTAFSTAPIDDWRARLQGTSRTKLDGFFGLQRPARTNPQVDLPAAIGTYPMGTGFIEPGGAHFQDLAFPHGHSGSATIRITVNGGFGIGRSVEASVMQFGGIHPDVCVINGEPLIALSTDNTRPDAHVIEVPVLFREGCTKATVAAVWVDPNPETNGLTFLSEVELEIEIHDMRVTITTDDLPDGESERPYPSTQLSSAVPGTWSIVSGAPDGMGISPTGLWSGRPSGGGIYDVVIGLEVDGHLTTKEFRISIDGPRFVTDNALAFPAIWLGDFEQQIETTVHGIPDKSTSLSKGLGDFPSGISMDSSGLITGVPGEFGTFEFFLKATDSRGLTATRAYRIWVFSL